MSTIITRKYFRSYSFSINKAISFINKYSVHGTINRDNVNGSNPKMFDAQNITVGQKPCGNTVLTLHIPRRRKSYFKHKYSAEVEAAVNKQIQAEEQAAQEYLNIAVAFLHPCQSRPGAGGFFMRMFDEEIGHMHDFIQYQLLRGGTPLIGGLTAPKSNMNITLLEAFQQALAMEKAVTVLLEDVVSVAESVKDYQCADFVTSIFLEEQICSINEIAHHVTKLTKLCDEHAVYHYDLQLVKKYPWQYKRIGLEK